MKSNRPTSQLLKMLRPSLPRRAYGMKHALLSLLNKSTISFYLFLVALLFSFLFLAALLLRVGIYLYQLPEFYRRDGVVVRGSASQSVDLGFIP